MEILEEEVRGGTKRKRIVFEKDKVDALHLAAFAEQCEAIYSGTIYVEAVAKGGMHYKGELPIYRIKRALNRWFDKISSREPSEVIATA